MAIELRAPLSRYFFVSRTLNSRGPSKHGYRAESPAQQLLFRVANPEFKGDPASPRKPKIAKIAKTGPEQA